MFKNVGKEMQKWAKACMVIMLIPVVLYAVFAFDQLVKMRQTVLGLLALIAICFFGYVGARVASLLLYGFGEMVKCMSAIDKKVNERPWPDPFEEPVPTPPTDILTPPTTIVTPPDYPVSYRNPDGTWNCVRCNCHNASDARYCSCCGKEVIFLKKSKTWPQVPTPGQKSGYVL